MAKNAILDNGNRDQTLGVITHVILCGWFLWCLRFRLRAAIMLFAILGGAIIVGQGVKSWVKERVQEPRPFVVWLEKTHHIPVDEFYTLKRTERGHLVKEQLAGQQNIPVFLRQHWQKRRALRFPPTHHVCSELGAFGRGSVMAAQTDFHHRVFVSLGDRRNGQPFASGNALAARFSGRHAHLPAISYPGDDGWRSEFAGRLCRLAKKRKKLLNASRKADNG